MDLRTTLKTAQALPQKRLTKLGTVAVGIVETTPVVFNNRLLRFEWIRNNNWGRTEGVTREVGYYHFVDMETEEEVCPPFALDHAFGCCYTENGVMYVHGVRGAGGGQQLDTFRSTDLIHWEMTPALSFPADISVYNTSVCKGAEGYIMAIELGGKNPIVGKAFTNVFASSADLIGWELLPPEKHIYSPLRYTACPSIRFYDGYYYMVYLEAMPLCRWVPYIVRSRDLIEFEPGLQNPVMWFSDEDKRVLKPERFTADRLEYIRTAINCNNSDLDFCDWQGKTVITYSWGNQHGKEFLARAEFDGSEKEFLQSFFK